MKTYAFRIVNVFAREGRLTGEFSRAEATQERIMHAATGEHAVSPASPTSVGHASPTFFVINRIHFPKAHPFRTPM